MKSILAALCTAAGTATYPDPALRTTSSTDLARTLDGDFMLTVKNGRLTLANSKPGGTYIIVR